MSLLDKLKEIIKIEINSPLLNINIDNSKTINSNNNGNSLTVNSSSRKLADGIYLDEKKQELTLDTGVISEDAKKQLLPLLTGYLDEGNKILEKNASTMFDRIIEYYEKESKNDRAILRFFNGVIPQSDYEALETALFIKSIFKEVKSI
ncbi:MAG: hypothetical protein V1718_04935 [archaeon]